MKSAHDIEIDEARLRLNGFMPSKKDIRLVLTSNYEEIRELRRTLRRFVIKPVIMISDGRGGEVMGPDSECRICNCKWPTTDPEDHQFGCIAALKD